MSERPSLQWASLRTSGVGDGNLSVPSFPTAVETGFGPARLAIGPNSEPRLLVPEGSAISDIVVNSGPNLHVGHSFYMMFGKNMPFIDVMLLERRLDGVFEELVREILARLGEGNSPSKAVGGAISDFRALLMALPPADVSDNVIAGLIGELLVLERLSDTSPAAVAAWCGPFEQRHDFRDSSRAIEVKTSLRSDATRVTIHGGEQLLPPVGGDVHLIHVRLEKASRGALQVGSLCNRILERGTDPGLLSAGLAALGCVDATAPEWNRISFEFEGLTAYRVDDGFPRISPMEFTTGNFPVGVTKLEYSIDLAAAASFRLDPAATDNLFRGFLS
ncbi:MAG: PD-(D/E)XK motif protein [Maritimibacter sp.]|nr:PD-(D/E)XK motif protein [Maritimibacter sp.]